MKVDKRLSLTSLLNGALTQNMGLPSIFQTMEPSKRKEIFGFIYSCTAMTSCQHKDIFSHFIGEGDVNFSFKSVASFIVHTATSTFITKPVMMSSNVVYSQATEQSYILVAE